MSAPIYVFKNRALQHAADMKTQVFRRAAQQVNPVVALTPPSTLPTPRYPFPDNSSVIVNGLMTAFMIQRDGLSFRMSHNASRNTFSLSQLNDPARKTFDSRQMTKEEAEYALQLLKDHLGPTECAVHQGPLNALGAALPDTPYPDSNVQFSPGKAEYSFNRHGCNHKVSAKPPYKCEVTYKDAESGNFRARDMRAEEIARARTMIVGFLSGDDCIKQQAFLQGLQDTQYKAAPSPATP